GENGFIALGLWIAIAVTVLQNCRYIIRRTKESPQLKWANDLAHMSFVAVIGYLVGGSFLSLSYWDFYFTLAVVLAATRRIVVAELAPEKPRFARMLASRSPPRALPRPGMAMQ